MRRSGSRTRATNSGAELSTRWSHLATALGSPRRSASSGLVSGSRTVVQFSNSVSSYSGPSGSVAANTRVSISSGHSPTPAGSTSTTQRPASGHERTLSATEQAHLGMLSSRSDSVIHGTAHQSGGSTAGHGTSGLALDAPTSVQITPISSTMESIFESRVSRDQRLRGRARSGEGTDVKRQLDDNSSKRAPRRSGSQVPLTRRSLSRTTSDREDSRPLQDLVEVDTHDTSSREGRIASRMWLVTLHDPSESKRESQRQPSLTIATHSSFPSSLLSGVDSSRQAHDSRSAASAEKTSSALKTVGIKGAMMSALQTEFESWKRGETLFDESRNSPIGLNATSAADDVVQKQDHGAVAKSREDLSGLSRLPSSGSSTRTAAESTKIYSQLHAGATTANREMSPQGAAALEVKSTAQAARAHQREQLAFVTENTTRDPGASQQMVPSEVRPVTSAETVIENRMRTFPSKHDFDKTILSNRTSSVIPGSNEKPSLITHNCVQNKDSQSIVLQSAHRGSLFSKDAHEMPTESSPAVVLIPSSLEKEDFQQPINQQSPFPTSLPSGRNFNTSALCHGLNKRTSLPRLLDQSTLSRVGLSEGLRLCTSSAPTKKSSRTIVLESTHHNSSNKPLCEISVSANQSEHQDFFEKSTAPAVRDVLDNSSPLSVISEKKMHSKTNVSEPMHLGPSTPGRTCSKSIIEQSVLQTIPSTKPPKGKVSAEAKEETLESPTARDFFEQKPVETDLKSYSLSTGTHLSATKRVETRSRPNEPVHQLLFERVEGSNYQTAVDNTQHSQLPARVVKSDYQTFQATSDREPTQAVVQVPFVTELPHITSQVVRTEHAILNKQNQDEEERESPATGVLTPLPELSRIVSTPKASSEDIRSSENERPFSKTFNQTDALNWPSFDIMGNHSTRLGEAAALFEEPSEGMQIQLEFTDKREMTDSASHAEDQQSEPEEASGRKTYALSTQEGTTSARASESLADFQIGPVEYATEQKEDVIVTINARPRIDSSLLNYTPDEYILAQIVREVEKKIEANSDYHYAPLPDDVLLVRSSKGIESLGQLRYETYEEELLMRHSEDDLTQKQERLTAKLSATTIKQLQANIDQGGYAGVLEVYYTSAEKQALQPKVTDLPAEKQTVQLEVIELPAERETQELEVSELPAEKETRDLKVPELPAEKKTSEPGVFEPLIQKQTSELTFTKLPAEREALDLQVAELPTQKQTMERHVPELPAMKETPKLKVTELPDETYTPVRKGTELPAEKQTMESKVAELPAEKQTSEPEVFKLLVDKLTSELELTERPAERETLELKVGKLSTEEETSKLNVPERLTEKASPEFKASEHPGEKRTPELKVTELPAEKRALELEVSEPPVEKETLELMFTELFTERKALELKVSDLPAEKQTSELSVPELPAMKETPELNVTEWPAEKPTWELKMTDLPAEKQTPLSKRTDVVPEKLSVDLMVTEVLPVKYTRELRVTELPAETQTVEAQVAELPFEKQRQGPEVTGALIAVIDQEGYSGVLEEFNESSEKRTPELKVTELPTGKRIPLSEGTKVTPEEQPLDLKITEVPPEKHTPELNVAELPAEKQTVEAEVAKLPVEEQTQVPEVADGLITVIDQQGYSGVLEEYYKSAKKRTPEPEPEEPVYAGTPPSLDVHEEAKPVVVDYAYAVTTETPEEKRATAKENERQKGEYAAEVEAEDKEPHPKKSFDVREERRRQSEQRWKKVPIVKGAQESAATVKYKEALQMPERTALTATRAETAEIRDKTFAEKQSSENVVRRLITAAIEEAAKREAAKSVKRFREFPCASSTEDASRKLRSSSSDTSTSERASRRKQEHRFADVKVQQENEKDMPLAELIEEMIQTHVDGSNINKHRLAREKQERAQDFARARAPGIPPNIGQQQIPIYYQTAATTPRLGDQYVEDNRPSLLSAPRKSDTQLVSSSRTEHRLSFSTLGGRGGRCVIRKLEPGALTYLVEVSPPDRNQENQTDMVMAEEQMLVSEIFDHITTPTMRVSSSGTTLNELAPITVSPAASLTAIRNAYAEAVARRVLGNQLYKSNEGVLSASQKAKFYESGPGVNIRKTASSTSVYSVPSVESYIVQSMLDGGVINSHKDLWSKRPAEFGSAIVSRSRSLDALANTATPIGTIAVPLPTPRDAEHEVLVDIGSGNGVKMAGQASREETPQYEAPTEIKARDEAHMVAEGPTEDAPGHATLENVIHETDTTPNSVETDQIAGAAGSADGHERTRSSSFPSNNGAIRGPERTAAADTAIATAQKQRPWVNLTSSENLNNTVDIDWNECVCCKKYTPPDKSFESFICFGLHETPKYFASVPPGVSDVIKLRIATDSDVREVTSLPWKEPEFENILPAAIVTRHILCPSTFFVAVDTLRGGICGAASVLVFDDEVAFCGFCHVLETYAFEHIGVLLWNQMLHVTSGKNLFTVLPEPAYRELHEIYPFPSNAATGILLGPVRFSRSAFKRTVLVLEYKKKYFDALASYDKHVFGFSRRRYLTSTLHEVGLDVRVATRNERNVCGYGGMQRGADGRLLLRWLFADDVQTAESLLYSLLASCSHDDEVDVVAGFYLRSVSTRPILDKVSSRELKPWRLVFTKREPLHSYGRVVCLTTV